MSGWLNHLTDRLMARLGRLSDNLRAAVLGVLFGLLMCVMMLTVWLIFGVILSIAR